MSKKPLDHELAAEYMEKLEHPMRSAIAEVREMILRTNADMTEKIKWNAPSFCHRGKDRITFQLNGVKGGGFRLVFHCGSQKSSYEGKEPLLADDTKLLRWPSPDRAVLTVSSEAEYENIRDQLPSLCARWIEATEEL